MAQDLAAVNGRIMPAASATISVLDLGFLRGVGAFETFRTYAGGHPDALEEHLRRLWDACAAFGVAPVTSAAEVRALVATIYAQAGYEELRVNLVVTPGINTTGVFGADTPTWVIIARDVHAPPPEHYRDGISAVTFPAERQLPLLKTTSYLMGATGMVLAARAGAQEAFYCDAEDRITEGVTSNVLIRRGDTIVTPVRACLPGITKARLKPLAQAHGLRWEERDLPRTELLQADEVWISSAVRELMPVVRVDQQPIAQGRPGAWAARLRTVLHERCVRAALADAGRG